ncbi:MAG: NAD+ synthase [Bacteroidia bacterium]|nr:MAG: NAD+ synthase [Bacteroidia bacterium]
MRITVAQLNFHVGNFGHNVDKAVKVIRDARQDGSDLVLFSELSVTGYPPLDLLEQSDFISECAYAIDTIKSECLGIAAVVGAPSVNRGTSGKKLFNSAYFLVEGEVGRVINKSLLPTYDIFDEYRYFEPSREFELVQYKGKKIAITICEDLWDEQDFDNEFSSSRMYSVSPMDELAKLNPDMILNLSASPFSASRSEMKRRVFTGKAAKHHLPLFMANQTGANTELIFDGGSMVIDPSGRIFDHLGSFRESVRTYSLDEVIGSEKQSFDHGADYIEMIHDALILGIRDYFIKMEFSNAVVGLSGGIDSAVVVALAVEALGSDKVRVLLMPSMYSSDHSLNDAIALSETLGIKYDIINIEDPYRSITGLLEPIMKGLDEDVTEENIQARLRAILLMAVSNKFGNILLNTSNKSEAAVGYGTLYGDMAGGLSVIGDIYKTDVYKLARFINKTSEIIPVNSIIKPPSAELRPGQVDSDSLPDYEILDNILYQYIELQRPLRRLASDGFDSALLERIVRMINNNEYKRFQAPPILRISSKAFGAGRRMPLVAKY